jgi:isoleucyl-tRNA synthetase
VKGRHLDGKVMADVAANDSHEYHLLGLYIDKHLIDDDRQSSWIAWTTTFWTVPRYLKVSCEVAANWISHPFRLFPFASITCLIAYTNYLKLLKNFNKRNASWLPVLAKRSKGFGQGWSRRQIQSYSSP